MDGWIVIPGWEKFQHYPDSRAIIWVKDYIDQLDRDEYAELTFAERGLLLDIRKLYARRRGLVRSNTKTLSRALTGRVTQQQLDALNHAGFIQIVASKPLALRALARREVEEKKKDLKILPPALKTKEPKPAPSTPPYKSNVQAADGYQAIAKMIRNGVIQDELYLDAEIRGYGLDEKLADELHQMLA